MKECYEHTGTKFLAYKMSQNMHSGTGSQLSKYMLEVEDRHLSTSDASDTMNSGTTE